MTASARANAAPDLSLVASGQTVNVSGSLAVGYAVVDNGLIQAGNLNLAFSVAGDGTLEVLPGGSVTVDYLPDSAGLTLKVDAGATLCLQWPSSGAGDTVVLAGNNAVLQLGTEFGGYNLPIGPTVTGFDATSTIDVVQVPVAGAVFVADSGNAAGTLTLQNNFPAFGIILLGDYADRHFVVGQQPGSGDSIVTLAPLPSPGTSSGDQFTWVGPASGDWAAIADWSDITTGNPAVVAPGSLDYVRFTAGGATRSIGGDVKLAALTLDGDNGFTGSIRVSGTATLASGTTELLGGATLDAARVVLGGRLLISGTASGLVAGTLELTDGAALSQSAGTLILGSLVVDPGANVAVELGDAAVTSQLVVSSGATLDLSSGNWVAWPVVDDGLIRLHDVYRVTGAVSGTGTLEVASGKNTTLDSVGGSVAVRLDSGASLTLGHGSGGSVVLSGSHELTFGVAGQTVVSEFDQTDGLFASSAATDLTFQSGTLTLRNAGTVVAAIQLAGDFTGERFLLDETTLGASFGYVQSVAVLLPADAGAVSPGSSTGEAFTWYGPQWTTPSAGNWNDAAHWQVASSPAVIAPGSLDQVSFAGGVFVAGSGEAASLNVQGSLDIAGTIAVAGTVTVANSPFVPPNRLTVQDGGTLSAAAISEANDTVIVEGTGSTLRADRFTLTGGKALLSSIVSEEEGALQIRDGGVVRLGALATARSFTLSVDATSILDIGGTSGAAGVMTVEQGATATLLAALTSTVYAPVVDDGVIRVGQVDLGSVSGTGLLEVLGGSALTVADLGSTGLMTQLDDGAALTLAGNFAAGAALSLVGSDHTIAIAGALQGGTITGFGTTDQLDLTFTAAQTSGGVSAVWQAGTLLLKDGGTIGSVAMPGDYTGRTFVVSPSGVVTLQPADSTRTATLQWAGGGPGHWSSPQSWTGASVGPPTIDDAAIINQVDYLGFDSFSYASTTVDGTGVAGSLQLGMLVDFAATVDVKGRLVGDYHHYAHLSLSGQLTAGTADLGADTSLYGGTLTADTLDLGYANATAYLDVSSAGNRGVVLAHHLTSEGAGGTIRVDSGSSFAVGDTAAAADTLQFESGTDVSLLGPVTLDANAVIVDGSIHVVGLMLEADAILSGSGVIEVTAGGSVDVAGAVANGAFALRIDTGATLTLDGAVGAGHTITMMGVGAVLGLTAANAGSATLDGFQGGDTIDLRGMSVTSTRFTENDAGTAGTLELLNLGTAVGAITLAGAYDPSAFTVAAAGSDALVTLAPGSQTACFANGTGIATPHGVRAVETLRPGDLVLTASGAAVPVAWMGHRRIDCRRHPRPHDVHPVRVLAHAFAPGQPARDLVLSPDHAVFAQGVLIPIRYVLNGASVVQEAADTVTYWHVELAAHDLLLAEGLACESYLDTGNRSAFANGGAVAMAHPEFSRQVWRGQGYAPLALDGPAVVAARRALLDRLPGLGFDITADPALRVLADGVALDAQDYADRLCFALPDGATALRLRSRTAAPAELDPHSSDTRRLGVAVAGLWLDGMPLPLDDPRLRTGWHQTEPGLRWTCGDAVLDVSGASIVELTLAQLLRYSQPWIAPAMRASA